MSLTKSAGSGCSIRATAGTTMNATITSQIARLDRVSATAPSNAALNSK